MKRALVFSGGGARGAYEVGVWQALKELNIHCDIVTGVSIGSINAAAYAEGELEKFTELWNNININTVFDEEIDDSTDKILLKEYIKKARSGGLQPNNLQSNLISYIDVDKIYSSNIEYGLITVKYPKMKIVELTKDKIKKEEFIDYLIASSTVFPVFKVKEIENEKYVDGGFRRPIPYKLAKKMGATDFIIVNISVMGKHFKPPKGKNIIYIKPHNNIGKPLKFDGLNSQKIMKYGYNDTMKVYNYYDGKKYTFKKLKEQYKEEKYLLTYNRYLSILEYLGIAFKIDDTKIYTIKQYKNELKKVIKKSNIMEKQYKELKNRKERIIYIYNKLNNKEFHRISKELRLRKEYLAALYLNKYL